jgi:hypothetical protein
MLFGSVLFNLVELTIGLAAGLGAGVEAGLEAGLGAGLLFIPPGLIPFGLGPLDLELDFNIPFGFILLAMIFQINIFYLYYHPFSF